MSQVNNTNTLLDEYIKTVTAGKPVYEIEIPHDENAVRDLFFPHMKGCDVVVLEDSDKLDVNPTNAEIIISQDSINRRVPECYQALLSEAHKDVVVEDIENRLRSGSFNADLDGDTPPPMTEFLTARLNALLEKRRTKLATEKMIWFTLRTEPNGDVYLNWPISAYMPVTAGGIYHDQKVQRACTRLKGRAHIKGIKVTGSVKPSAIPLYFQWVGSAMTLEPF